MRSLATTVFVVDKYTVVTKWRSPVDVVVGLGGSQNLHERMYITVQSVTEEHNF